MLNLLRLQQIGIGIQVKFDIGNGHHGGVVHTDCMVVRMR